MIKKITQPLCFFTVSLFLFAGCGQGPDPRDSDSPFGMLDFLHWSHEWNKMHYESFEEVERSIRMMKEAGVAFVRMDILWADVEPQQGTFDFSRYDPIIDLLWESDIKILGLLNYNATWTGKEWNAAPDPDLYTDYARAVVHRYKSKIKYWEIWNEPDDKLYWQPQDYMKSYTQLLKKVYPALKKEDPTCRIVMGGIAKYIPQSLKHIYRNGGKDYFDIVNCHPFQDPMLPQAIYQLKGTIDSLRKVMKAFDDGDKDIWFTELGAPGIDKSRVTYGWWLGDSPNEELQARWLRKIYENMSQWPGVKKIFWAFFRDLDGFFDSSVNDFGIVRHDFSPKPSYDAYKEITGTHTPQTNP